MQIDTAYRLKLYPGRDQASQMSRFAGATRWLWNYLLDLQMKRHEAAGEFVFRFDMQAMLPALKAKYPWLSEAPSCSLQRVCQTLDQALRNSFQGAARRGFPKFKGKFNSKTSFYVTNTRMYVRDGKVRLPKIGGVRFRGGKIPEGKLMSATVEFDGRNWWCTIQAKVDAEVAPVAPAAATVIGADMGLKELLVTSDGERVPASRPLRKAMKRLARAQRVLARRKKGSERRKRQAAVVRHLHRVVGNCRSDALHKVSRSLVNRASAVVIEDLSVKGLARTRLALSIADAAMGELRRQITYKLGWAGKSLVVVDRFFPSTQTCSSCGVVKTGAGRLKLNHRVFRCECGHVMDRDLNAAMNLRRHGLQSLGLLCSDIEVGQAMPEPASALMAPTPNARGEPAAGPAASAAGRHDSVKREPQHSAG